MIRHARWEPLCPHCHLRGDHQLGDINGQIVYFCQPLIQRIAAQYDNTTPSSGYTVTTPASNTIQINTNPSNSNTYRLHNIHSTTNWWHDHEPHEPQPPTIPQRLRTFLNRWSK